ncbi:MAG: acetyl-CoA C-acyltransferase [Candidatus Dormibacteria bacterium]
MTTSDRDCVIVSTARTPVGKMGGTLAAVPAVDLGAHVMREAIARAGITPDQVDYNVMGIVVNAGTGQVPSRQAAIRAGIPTTVPSLTVNKVCASSLKAVNLAAQMIRTGDVDVAVAGGMESMSGAPYLVPGGRFGYRMGDAVLVDAMMKDGLWCPVGDNAMHVYGSTVAAEFEVSREMQDEWSLRSQQRYAAAKERGFFNAEIAPLEIPGRRGPTVVAEDEGPRPDTTLEALAALKPLIPGGTVTAGNAPGVNDGASALVLMSRARARELGAQVLATWVSMGESAEDPPYLATVPASSIRNAAQRAGVEVRDLGLVEINEAFAAVAITSTNLLGVDPEIVNVNGGAVAIGHPIGASGGRILMTLIHEMRARGAKLGAAGICSGMGQGEATIVRID